MAERERVMGAVSRNIFMGVVAAGAGAAMAIVGTGATPAGAVGAAPSIVVIGTPNVGPRIGVLTDSGTVKANEGSLNAPLSDQDSDVLDLTLAGDRVGVLTADHRAKIKTGDLTGTF